MIDSSIKKATDVESQTLLEPFEIFRASDRADETTLLDDVRTLYRILSHQHLYGSANEVMSALLSVGCARFGMSHGIVLHRISDQVFDVKAVLDPDEALFVGQHLTSSVLPLLQRHENEKLIVEQNISELTIKTTQFAYNLDEPSAYIGLTTRINGDDGGIVCFLVNQPLKAGIDQEDMVLLELLAEGIACMTELQSARAQRKAEDLAIFASGSLKSLEEYQASAELPEGLGISGKVVEVLKRRIGQSSLSIDNIAEELNLSKRTLQRRLQQQGISFAELRDRVRFHYAIDFLVKQQISIDRISSTLDFSDRTSFTNAFKRWTGLSPSTFRKVFRDYV